MGETLKEFINSLRLGFLPSLDQIIPRHSPLRSKIIETQETEGATGEKTPNDATPMMPQPKVRPFIILMEELSTNLLKNLRKLFIFQENTVKELIKRRAVAGSISELLQSRFIPQPEPQPKEEKKKEEKKEEYRSPRSVRMLI